MVLADLKVGESGRVRGFAQSEAIYRRKLMAMGLTLGAEFTITRLAPLGDPVEIRVRGSALTLRKDEAAALRIEKI
ncbi:iron transporter FeoA [Acidihalobacter yilgarnensis]|uniref:Iron transporter FeoA n=1 Tax=Acidihalobacter yilgarnensis TaxID=2819280 RepID=A0A1D8IL51_9GAMM|nr:FeoA family protein [Acidihalobacter yilgarnensis]AOU97163.1 iron transporter FeoA [Acidihalobacter yilgarnensis]